MVNLNTTFRVCPERVGSARELPVLVDLNWLGRIMTLPNGGIITSQACRESSNLSNLSI